MWLIVNCLLLMIAAAVLAIGIEFFVNNKKTNNNTRFYILLYCIFSALWCTVYGAIGITDNLELAASLRCVGIFAIDGFLVVETVLITGMSKAGATSRWISRGIAAVLSVLDLLFFSDKNVDIFLREGNWTTWISNPDYALQRNLHLVYVVAIMLNLFVAGLLWARNNKIKRHNKFILVAFAANFLLVFFTIPDTFLPKLGMHAIPTSGIGSALCSIVIWYGAAKLNSFDIQMSNILPNIYDFLNAGILVFDTNFKIAMANPYAQQLLPGNDVKSYSLEDVFNVKDVSTDEIFAGTDESIYSNTFEALTNGRMYSVRVSAAKDNYDQTYCYLCALLDVTESTKMLKDLETANNAKTKFLTSISHEIRTPINAVLGFNEMIIRQTDKSEIIHYADNISRAGKMLLAIINDLLDMGQLSSGQLNLVPLEYELSKILSDVYTLQKLKAEEKELSFTIANDEYIPNRLFGDSLRIQQIITNLVTNAIKYTAKGSVHMQIDYREKADEEIDLIISVKDTGMGIKEEDLPYLYDTFKRFDEVKNKHIEGTGVGLAITHNLIEQMKGSITVQSTYGLGTCFTVVLPQQVVGREPVGSIGKYKNVDKTDRSIHFTAPEANIIAVDDNDMNLMVFAGSTKHLQMKVETAKSGYALLEKIKEKKYDIIFLDHMMPEMDGIETLKRMRASTDHLNTDTPVIIMTANTIRGAKEEYLKEGFNDYIGKPAEVAVLEKMIKHYLKPELIRYPDNQTEDKKETTLEELFPRVEGVNWSLALKNMPDPKILLELVKTFYTTAEGDSEVICNAYGDIRKTASEEAYSTYRIKVHSMKNSAALVGAEELSKQAKVLEFASRDKKAEVLEAEHESFVQNYRNLAEKLRVALTGENPVSVPARRMAAETLSANLLTMENAMKEFDTEALNSMVLSLEGYTFASPEITENINAIKAAIRDFDQEGFFKLIEATKKMIS